MATRRRREYLLLLDAAKAAAGVAVDAFNRVHNPYRNEGTLIALTNARELLAKAVLVQQHQSIRRGQRGETIGPSRHAVRFSLVRACARGEIRTLTLLAEPAGLSRLRLPFRHPGVPRG